MTSEKFAAIEDQRFDTFQEWVAYATVSLTAHPDYCNTEHGAAKGSRGRHFTALCFDQKGRLLHNGGDFMRARDEGAFPVWWIWPDQIPQMLGYDIGRAA